MLSQGRNSSILHKISKKCLIFTLKQVFLKCFYIYWKQNSQKKKFHIFIQKSILRTVSNQKYQSVFICNVFLFFIFYNIFYTQIAFAFHAEEDFYIVCNHILYFCFFFLRKILLSFTSPFLCLSFFF